ncbi:MAG: hypothetical protein R3E86_22430 [Pseudomonadales bacterium]
MSETYRLVFRGEVLDGQHPAVVRKRLAQALNLDEPRMDRLFSGEPVVLKREADTAAATHFQALFKKAGARLRVLPVAGHEAPPVRATGGGGRAGAASASGSGESPRTRASSGQSDQTTVSEARAGQPGMVLLPPGSDVLRDDERSRFEPAMPDTSHISLAQPGTRLSDGSGLIVDEVAVPDFAVAELGTRLGEARTAAAPAVDLDEIDFDVAEAGAELGEKRRELPPAPPDTSHLSVRGD